jgi:hypothetical protein
MSNDHTPELVEAVQDAADEAFGSGVLTGPTEAAVFLERLERQGFTVVATDDLVDVNASVIAPPSGTSVVVNVQVAASASDLPELLAVLRDLR